MLSQSEKGALEKISKINDIDSELQSLLLKIENNLKEIKEIGNNINLIIKEKSQGFPWISDIIAQYYESRALKLADYLENKSHPALKSAEEVRKVAREKREVEKKFRVTYNLIKYYEVLFPWLSEFVGEDLDDLIKQVIQKDKEEIIDDPVRLYLTTSEYQNLSTAERNQKALDRYWTKKKNSWEIGRDYERFVGYQYEKSGFSVYY